MSSKASSSLDLGILGKSAELRQRIFYVIFILILYRLGTYIPIPGVNARVLAELSNVHNGGILGMFNMFTGGALSRMSIFALNIMPYIAASIIMQLLSLVSNDISMMRKEGDSGRKKLSQYTRYLTVLIAICQGYGMAVGMENMAQGSSGLIYEPGFVFKLVAVVSLLGGTMFVMWLGEQITARGIGNGSSVIIYAGIISGLPSAIAAFFEMGRTGSISPLVIIGVIAMAIALIYVVVFVERAQRRISIHYPKRQVGNKMYNADSTHLPLKINTSGVIPPIFASALLLFPATIAGFASEMSAGVGWRQWIALYLGHGQPLYIILYIALIVFFSFFYTSIVFNPEETAEQLNKAGGVVIGRRPGKKTAEYFDWVLTRLTVLGAIYMALVCVVPELMISQYAVPFYLGGTSLLIIVNVVLDLFSQIQGYLLSARYDRLIKKSKLRGVIR